MNSLEKKFYYLLNQPETHEPGNRVEIARKFAEIATRMLSWQRPRDSKGHFIKKNKI